MKCDSEHRSHTCILEAPHPGRHHRWEEPDGILGTHVIIWVDIDDPDGVQPDYPLGAVDMSEPWIVRSEEFRG